MQAKINKLDILNSKAGNWMNFLAAVDTDRKERAKLLTWSAYVDFLNDEIGTTTHLPTSKAAPIGLTTADTGTFADLFYDAKDLLVFTTALRKVRMENPVLNDKGEWIGGKRDGSKSILVAGIDRVEACRKIRKIYGNDILIYTDWASKSPLKSTGGFRYSS